MVIAENTNIRNISAKCEENISLVTPKVFKIPLLMFCFSNWEFQYIICS